MSPTQVDNSLFIKIKKAFSNSEHHFTFFPIDYTKCKGWKWQFCQRFLTQNFIKRFNFDYIMVWDDDLDIHNFNIDLFIKICKAFKIEIAQPALGYNSYFTHAVTLKSSNPNVVFRITDFVEIMCPVFTKEAWLKLYPYLEYSNEQGWGYDSIFKFLGKCAIIDSQPIQHTRKLNEHGSQCQVDLLEFLNKHKLKKEYQGNMVIVVKK